MVFVDHVIGYLSEGGDFIETTSDSVILSIVMLIAAILIWEIVLLIKDPKGVLKSIKR
jgi:hypothetical protein